MGERHTPNNLLLVITLILFMLVGGAIFFASKQAGNEKLAQTTIVSPRTVRTSTPQDSLQISYEGVEKKTALELLKAKATVVTRDSYYGSYVHSINAVESGTEGKYWVFYINGHMAQVGPDRYVTKAGDNIEWKFE